MEIHGLRRVAALALALAATGALVATPAPAGGSGSPPGNNGTVKVDGTPFDTRPDNQPHVGCTFQVDLYGYDLGDLQAEVLFEAVPPTSGAEGPAGTELLTDTLEIGGDEAGGGNDLDAEGTYDLTAALAGIAPHPQQGWHVRLTIDAEGSQGARVKHKVFWVSGCGGGTTTTTTPHGSTTSTTAPHGTTTTTAPHGSTTTTPGTPTTTPGTPTTAPGGPTTSATTTPDGPTTTVRATTTTVDAGGTLPRTGSSATGTLVAAGLALVAVGALAIGAVRLRAGR